MSIQEEGDQRLKDRKKYIEVISDRCFINEIKNGDIVSFISPNGYQTHHIYQKFNDKLCRLDNELWNADKLIDYMDENNLWLVKLPDQ